MLALLAAQFILFWVSMSGDMYANVFCAVSRNGNWRWIGWIHPFYLGWFIFGLLSLHWPKLRAVYLAGLLFTLPLLALQQNLVESGELFCDGP